jgi:hypothetical protein
MPQKFKPPHQHDGEAESRVLAAHGHRERKLEEGW